MKLNRCFLGFSHPRSFVQIVYRVSNIFLCCLDCVHENSRHFRFSEEKYDVFNTLSRYIGDGQQSVSCWNLLYFILN